MAVVNFSNRAATPLSKISAKFLGRVNTGYHSDYDGLLKYVRDAREGETCPYVFRSVFLSTALAHSLDKQPLLRE